MGSSFINTVYKNCFSINRSVCILFIAICARAVAAGDGAISRNSIVAREQLQAKVGETFVKQESESQKREWLDAYLALIDLERLSGNEEKALKLFAKIEPKWRELITKSRWVSVQNWGCSKKKEANICPFK